MFCISVALAFMALTVAVSPSIVAASRVCQMSGGRVVCIDYGPFPAFPLLMLAFCGALVFCGIEIEE